MTILKRILNQYGPDRSIHLAKVMTQRRPRLGTVNTLSVFIKYGELLDYHYFKKNIFGRVLKIAKSDY
jgi:hypothetical protein